MLTSKQPMPPYSPLFGHLLFAYEMTRGLPIDAHPNYLPDRIRRALPDLDPVYYIDTWPFGPQMLVVASTNSLYQVTQEHSLPKYHAMKDFLWPITNGLDIVTMEGQQWKKWRGIFNPGFSASHLATLTAAIIEETETFCDNLAAYARNGNLFRMKDLTDNLAMDVIGRVVLDSQLDSQKRPNPLVDGLRMQIRWLTFGADVNPFVRYNPVRPLVHLYNTRRMNNYVANVLERRMIAYKKEQGNEGLRGTKSIMDLSLAAYMSEYHSKEDANTATKAVDSTYKAFAMSQIKLFLFSGHDTTSSTICYIFYVLSRYPEDLARVQAELNSILGPEGGKTGSAIAENPALLNRLPYTLAVLKEVLRLYPAVSSVRAGEPGFNVTDDSGRRFPTDKLLVWANPQTIHRDPAYWPQADHFLPDRWLVPPGHELYPIKGAWRPFEHGPRNCIGQELAMIEMKIIMVFTLRRFDIRPVYEEVDLHKKHGRAMTVYGERGYQIQRAQPSDNLPCRVTEHNSARPRSF